MTLRTLGDEIFPNLVQAFAWLDQYEGRKAEIALDLLQVAYATDAPRMEVDHVASTEPI